MAAHAPCSSHLAGTLAAVWVDCVVLLVVARLCCFAAADERDAECNHPAPAKALLAARRTIERKASDDGDQFLALAAIAELSCRHFEGEREAARGRQRRAGVARSVAVAEATAAIPSVTGSKSSSPPRSHKVEHSKDNGKMWSFSVVGRRAGRFALSWSQCSRAVRGFSSRHSPLAFGMTSSMASTLVPPFIGRKTVFEFALTPNRNQPSHRQLAQWRLDDDLAGRALAIEIKMDATPDF